MFIVMSVINWVILQGYNINSNVWLKCDVFNLNMKEFKYIRCVKNLFSSPSETLNREWGGGLYVNASRGQYQVGGTAT